jgi:hypothetical protein
MDGSKCGAPQRLSTASGVLVILKMEPLTLHASGGGVGLDGRKHLIHPGIRVFSFIEDFQRGL